MPTANVGNSLGKTLGGNYSELKSSIAVDNAWITPTYATSGSAIMCSAPTGTMAFSGDSLFKN